MFKNPKIVAIIAITAIVIVLAIDFKCRQSVSSPNITSDTFAILHNRINDITRQRDGLYVELNQAQGNEAQARLLAGDLEKKLKSLQSVTKLKVGTSIKEVLVPFYKPIDVAQSLGSTADTTFSNINKPDSCLPLPAPFALQQRWYYIAGNVTAKGLAIDSTGFNPGALTVAIGDKRNGFLRRPTPVVMVKSENPYININYGTNVVVTDQRRKGKATRAFILGLGIGFIGGVFVR